MQIGLLHLWVTLLLQTNWVYSTVSCPSGDTSGIVKNGQTCSQLIFSANNECYNATIETSCCASCNTIATDISGCQYGDRVTNCIDVLCPYYTVPSECCSTCLTTTTTITTTTSTTPTTTTTIPAMTTMTTSTTSPTTMTPATITTTTLSPARNVTTGSTSQAYSSLSTSAGVIAAAIVASIAGAGLMVGLTYSLFLLFTGKQLRRVVSSSTAKEDVID